MTVPRTPHVPFLSDRSFGLHALIWCVAAAALSLGSLSAVAQGGAPTVEAPVPDAELRVGYDPYRIHLEDYFGGRHEECIAESSDESVARVVLQGFRVRVIPVGAGTATITVGAINGAGTTTQTFQVTVTYPAPGIGDPLPDTEVRVSESITVDLTDAFTGLVLDMTATVSAEEHATASVRRWTPREGPRQSELTLAGLLHGPVTVTVVASNEGGSTERTFALMVRDIPPMVATALEPVSMYADATVMVDLEGAFSGTHLTYSAASSADDMAAVSVDGSMLSISGGLAGEPTVTVTATNNEGNASQEVMVTVMDVPPEVAEALEPASVYVDSPMTFDLSGAFSGTNLEYAAMSSSEEMATVSVDGAMLTVSGHLAGDVTVTVTASNTAGEAVQDLMVTVKDVPPAVVAPLDAITLQVGMTETVDVAGKFSGTNLEYSAMSSSEEMATVSVDGTMVTVTALVAGPVTVTVTASNTAGSVSQDMMVTVEDVPPAVAEPLDPISLQVGMMETVDLSGAFSGTALTYTAMSSSEEMATVSVDGAMLTVTGLVAGPVTVTVTATNTAGSASQDLDVTVEDVPPAVAEMLSDIEVRVGDTMMVDISGAFSGTALQYSAMSSSDAMATVALEGTSLSVTGVAAGPATVTVTAMNSAASAYQMFEVNVRDVPPGAVGALPDISLVAGGAPQTINLAEYFSGTALVFGATGTGEAVRVSLAGAQLTVEPAIEGVATVTVNVSNTEGAISSSFDATVMTSAAEADAIERSLAAIGAATLSSVQSAFSARFRGHGAAVPAEPSSFADAASGGAFDMLDGPYGGASGTGGWYGADWNRPDWGGAGAHRQDWGSPNWNAGPMSGAWGDGRGYGSGYGTYGPMANQSFIMPLSASGGAGDDRAFSVWGHADWQSFEGSGIDGDLSSVYLGVDMTVGDGWLVGLAASQSDGDVDYRFSSDAASGRGSLSTDMMSVFPYARFEVDQCTELWAVLGFGSGDIESRRSAVARTSVADLSMSMVSAGGSRVVSSGEGWSITLLGDVASLNMDTDGITGAISNVEVDVRRIRAAVEGKRTVVMDDGGRVVLFGQLGARSDSGDGDTGQGAEISAGVRYNTAGRFSVEFMGRFLANHSEDDVEESAFSISAMLRPESDGSGVSVALSSRLGRDFGLSGVMPGVDYDYVRRVRGIRDDWGFDARVGYGMADTGLPGVLTPFAKMDLTSAHRRGARIGARFDAESRLVRYMSVEVSAGSAYHFLDDTMAGLVELRGELRF